jgi:hypothetical protein
MRGSINLTEGSQGGFRYWAGEDGAEGRSLCGRAADHAEGVATFLEKREPGFTGR